MNKKTQIVSALIWGSLMVPALLLASGCIELGCTLAHCEDQSTIVIHKIQDDQVYEVAIETGEATIQCTIDKSLEFGITCDGNVLYSNRQLDTADIAIHGAPGQIIVTVWQDGTMIAQDELMPDYDEFAPNGESCGPVCRQATTHVVL